MYVISFRAGAAVLKTMKLKKKMVFIRKEAIKMFGNFAISDFAKMCYIVIIRSEVMLLRKTILF
jgi:hypothetical protein